MALIGELLVTQAQSQGVAGILVDGAVRDLDELREIGLPIWARWVRAQGATKGVVGALDIPVVIGGRGDRPGRPRRHGLRRSGGAARASGRRGAATRARARRAGGGDARALCGRRALVRPQRVARGRRRRRDEVADSRAGGGRRHGSPPISSPPGCDVRGLGPRAAARGNRECSECRRGGRAAPTWWSASTRRRSRSPLRGRSRSLCSAA